MSISQKEEICTKNKLWSGLRLSSKHGIQNHSTIKGTIPIET